MSRSIHTTRRTISRLAKKKFASAKDESEALSDAKAELRRKRLIKRQVAGERKLSALPLVGTDVETISIEAHHASQFVHHSASIKDLRSILKLLPPAATEGISSIKLILGKEYIDKWCENESAARDPFTGRLSHETLPGVYSGDVWGIYSPSVGRVTLHAHVYDPTHLPISKNACEIYLRLKALQTFVHEIAHHHDKIRRVARGRWLADRKENVEWYAEKMEHDWTRELVIPFLEKTYPNEVKELLDFVEQKGGLRLPLEFFAGDSRNTLRNGLVRLSFSTSSAFEHWAEKLANCKNLAESWLAFAWELHYADQYESCLTILDRILVDEPSKIDALTCKADTLIHLERSDEAFEIAEAVLNSQPSNGDAWKIRGDVFEDRKNWNALLENCKRWLESVSEDSKSLFYAYQYFAIAHCALGNFSEMEKWIDKRANFGGRNRKVEFIRKAVYRRAGHELPK
jgi:tetratricopeptide (TPR) repeat protein